MIYSPYSDRGRTRARFIALAIRARRVTTLAARFRRAMTLWTPLIALSPLLAYPLTLHMMYA